MEYNIELVKKDTHYVMYGDKTYIVRPKLFILSIENLLLLLFGCGCTYLALIVSSPCLRTQLWYTQNNLYQTI